MALMSFPRTLPPPPPPPPFGVGRPSALDDLEKTPIDKEIEKLLKQAKSATKVLDKIHGKLGPMKATAKMGVIPIRIYKRNPTPQNNALATLPPEIQRMVWSYLVLPADRIAFGLSCKSHAQVFEELKPVYNKIAIRNYTPEHRLAVLIRMITWMPTKYKLCFGCVRFDRTTKRSDWRGDSAKLRKESVRGAKVIKAARIEGPRCLKCQLRERMDRVPSRKAVREMKALLRKNQGTPEDGF